MLKKTAAAAGLMITATAGVLATCAPAFAAPALAGHSQTHLVANHNRNWNGSENENFNHIRLRLHNRNNNIAVARTRGNNRRNDGAEFIRPNEGD
ncbi:hypothetical protein [Actinoallomurus iriomotensis]|uniref:Uncharacterized protein n=1 Tax=Actinoallomurus iriomotensis TaxID=478107 RepID=A0A9W6VPU7_9ACTN|nr:hypothetical protein [Actinoallomurus iriomotensis]GLY74812.1 hypothetical protein Airi01_030790 [Actinoallomurus iriomotensis]